MADNMTSVRGILFLLTNSIEPSLYSEASFAQMVKNISAIVGPEYLLHFHNVKLIVYIYIVTYKPVAKQ
jgi:hypothetical protein